ncbi:MAG: serine/threonine protein kinase [Deltaproteobacteria bacterium]|nr:serine/threonine protein kinase [Deltaproteobacteria bacterium]
MLQRVGNYRIEGEIGKVNGGVLLRGTHLFLPRRAVVKVVNETVAGLQPFAVQLLREACILEALHHAGVPQVYESGLLPDRRPWFAAEPVAGETLGQRIGRGPLPVNDVAMIVRDLAEVLEHAHRRGVIHRALRPERIVLTAERRHFALSVVDWSEARTHDAGGNIPHVPTPGSRAYVAPELVRGDALDDRADVYALGVIAYQALTGHLPREINAALAPHVPALERRPEAPRELAQLVDQMLSIDRFDRPASAEVRADLDFLTHVLAHAPVQEVLELVDSTGVGYGPRIRKPRWTPAVVAVRPEELPVVPPGARPSKN